MKNKKKLSLRPYFVNFLKLCLAVGLIYWLVSSGKLDFKLLSNLTSFTVLFPAILIVGINIILNSERWRVFLVSQKLESNFFSTLKLTLIGIFFNYVIPGGVGGDVVKGYYVAQLNPQNKANAVVTVAMDRLIGLFTMLMMALSIMIYDWNLVRANKDLKIIFSTLLIIAVLFCTFWVFVFSRRAANMQLIEKYLKFLPFHKKILKTYSTFSKYSQFKKVFFRTVFLSVLAQTFAISFFIFIGRSLGFTNVSYHTYFFVIPIGFMITAIPISPAGVGVGQAAFFYLFKMLDPNSGMIGSTAITANQIFLFLFGIVGAILYSTMKSHPKNFNVDSR